MLRSSACQCWLSGPDHPRSECIVISAIRSDSSRDPAPGAPCSSRPHSDHRKGRLGAGQRGLSAQTAPRPLRGHRTRGSGRRIPTGTSKCHQVRRQSTRTGDAWAVQRLPRGPVPGGSRQFGVHVHARTMPGANQRRVLDCASGSRSKRVLAPMLVRRATRDAGSRPIGDESSPRASRLQPHHQLKSSQYSLLWPANTPHTILGYRRARSGPGTQAHHKRYRTLLSN